VIEGDFQAPNWLDLQRLHHNLVGYVVELVGFPGTKYDDQVDSTTQALDHMREDDVFSSQAIFSPTRFAARLRRSSVPSKDAKITQVVSLVTAGVRA
jgi:hypothetical protein